MIVERERPAHLTEFDFAGHGRLPVVYGETFTKKGYGWDTYSVPGGYGFDLAIIDVQPYCATPNQEVLEGISTVEAYMSGSGMLRVIRAWGDVEVHSFGYGQPKQLSVTVLKGDKMRWFAGPYGLKASEVCYPPYEDGRFRDLP